MARIVNGTVMVPQFTSTGNVGEYQISGGVYLNQADTAGNGAYDVQVGFVIYAPASDPNTFMMIPGVVHRYKITSVTIIDQSTVDLVVIWDEPGSEIDTPTNGVECVITQTSTNKHYGYPVSSGVYPDLDPAASIAVINNDIQNITDVATVVSSGSTATYLYVQGVASDVWTVAHNKGSINYVYTIFDDTGEQCLPNEIETVDQNNIKLHFLTPMAGKAMFMFL